MRVVVDTNVIISAAISKKSTSFLALELVIDFHKILISSPTFEELQGTLYQLLCFSKSVMNFIASNRFALSMDKKRSATSSLSSMVIVFMLQR